MRYLKTEYHRILAENADLFDLVESNGHEGAWLYDLKNENHFWINARGSKLLGKNLFQLHDWINSITPASWLRMEDSFKAIVAGDPLQHVQEIQLVNQVNETQRVLCTMQLVLDAAQQVDFIIGALQFKPSMQKANWTVHDVTVKRYDDAQHLAQIGHWEWDHQTDSLFWSDEIYHIHEMDSTQLEPNYTQLMEFIHPDDREVFEKVIQSAIATHTPFHHQHRLILSNKRVKHIDAHGITTYDKAGKPLKTIGTIQDITHIRKFEEEVYKSNSIFNNAMDLLCIAGFDGYFKVLNPAWSRQLGWSIDEMLELPWNDFVHPEDLARTDDIKAVIVDGKEIMQFENRYRCKDGSYKWLSWNSFSYPEEGVMFGVARNITDQKAAEAALNATHEKLTKLAAQVPGVVYQFQLFPDRRTCFPFASPGIEQIYAVTPEQVQLDGSLVFDRLHPEDRERVTAEIFESAEKLSIFHCQYRVILPGKEPGWRLSNARPERMPDGSTLWYGIITDITESVNHLKRIESLLQIEEEQNKRLRNFTHIVSHNLRSHTANMMGIFTLLELESPEWLEQEYISMIKSAAENLTETIAHLNQVLDINLTAKEKVRRIYLNNTINTAISSISLLAKNAGVELVVLAEEEVYVEAVPAYMDSIVLNMLTNAIKFRAEDRAAFVKIGLQKNAHEIVLRFEDNGLGIDLARHGAKLFGMYKTFHGHKDSKGLGLFITKNHIEAMGGSISVESEVDKGTIFIIKFPI